MEFPRMSVKFLRIRNDIFNYYSWLIGFIIPKNINQLIKNVNFTHDSFILVN